MRSIHNGYLTFQSWNHCQPNQFRCVPGSLAVSFAVVRTTGLQGEYRNIMESAGCDRVAMTWVPRRNKEKR